MERSKKKIIQRAVAGGCMVVLILALAAMPLLVRQSPDADGPQASILSGTVAHGQIETVLRGGGTLTAESAVTVTVPTAVKLTEYLVANEDLVQAGDVLATVDRVSVMNAITQVQQTLEYLSEKMEDAAEDDDESKILACSGGVVKKLYAQTGERVEDIMLEHGALAVLSLDGLMAVDVPTQTELAVGTAVQVTFADGQTVDGEVAANLSGTVTVTVEDADYPIAEMVRVMTVDGTNLGSGALYVYTPWNAIAYGGGTVGRIAVAEGDTVRAGAVLMKLEDVGQSTVYQQLLGQRQEYEALMLELFELYQTEQITAPCDGMVSGVDADSVQLLRTEQGQWKLNLLANAPNGDDETVYRNYVAQVYLVGPNGWELNLNPQNIDILDYQDLSAVPLDPTTMTESAVYLLSENVPIYEWTGGAWVQISSADVKAGDMLLFAGDSSGRFVWIVRVQRGAEAPSQPETPTEPPESTEPTAPDVPTEPTEPTNPTEPTSPEGSGSPTGGNSHGGSMGGFPQGGTAVQEPEFECYELEQVQIAAVTPQNTMAVTIQVDELDITALKTGMQAQVAIAALGGEKFTAEITAIGNTGANNGGNSKYSVELTMARAENMLPGMNVTVSVVVGKTGDVLTIPASALVEDDTQTLVYTDYDAKTETLCNPVAVRIGASDGETVELLDGLSDGSTYYYAYYDTLELSSAPDLGTGRGLFGRK